MDAQIVARNNRLRKKTPAVAGRYRSTAFERVCSSRARGERLNPAISVVSIRRVPVAWPAQSRRTVAVAGGYVACSRRTRVGLYLWFSWKRSRSSHARGRCRCSCCCVPCVHVTGVHRCTRSPSRRRWSRRNGSHRFRCREDGRSDPERPTSLRLWKVDTAAGTQEFF